MSNAGLDESTEEMHEVDVAEIKKLKVRWWCSIQSGYYYSRLIIRCKSFAHDLWNWA